jgi:DNA-binding MarR family transcriptional regulator
MRLTTKIDLKKGRAEELQKEFPEFRLYYFEAMQAIFGLANDLEKAIDQFFYNSCGKFSRARFLILVILMHSKEDKLTPNEIAKRLNVTRGNMTGLIDSLLEAEFVTKIQDENDRRQVWIQITPKAEKFLHEKVFPTYFKKIAKVIGGLKKDEIILFTKMALKIQAAASAFIPVASDQDDDSEA